jgi:WD40 repeat protein
VLCGTLTAKGTLFTAGESNELLKHEGPVFKGQGQKIQNPHTGFVNAMRLSPDGSKFATASGDKTIAVFNAEDGSLLKHIKAAHAMSVVDLAWIDNEHFVTCSSDNNVKKWNCNEDKALEELTQGDAKRDPSRQLVAVIFNRN